MIWGAWIAWIIDWKEDILNGLSSTEPDFQFRLTRDRNDEIWRITNNSGLNDQTLILIWKHHICINWFSSTKTGETFIFPSISFDFIRYIRLCLTVSLKILVSVERYTRQWFPTMIHFISWTLDLYRRYMPQLKFVDEKKQIANIVIPWLTVALSEMVSEPCFLGRNHLTIQQPFWKSISEKSKRKRRMALIFSQFYRIKLLNS
jgi:hypothetical protein